MLSNQGRQDREVWVTKQLLSKVRRSTRPSEIRWIDGAVVDTAACGAEFQVKEILDRKRRRHKQFLKALASAKHAKKPPGSRLGPAYEPLTLAAAERRIAREVGAVSKRYSPTAAAATDLLLYFNTNKGVDLQSDAVEFLPKRRVFKRWRSVSVVFNNGVLVLSAAEEAPRFLRKNLGKVFDGG
jgi:hypothetical protein